MISTGSMLVLVTTTPKLTVPPGSGTLAGRGVLSNATEGSTSSMVTSARPRAKASLPSSSESWASTKSVLTSPALPVTSSLKLQVYVAPGAMATEPSATQSPRPSRSP